jgi:adenylate cyclase
MRPTVLGVALDSERTGITVSGAPVLTVGVVDGRGLWQGRGWRGPPTGLATVASGHGLLAIAADPDGIVRRVPLLAAADGRLLPGLAADLVRVAEDATGLILNGTARTIQLGTKTAPLPYDGMLRLVPMDSLLQQARTVSAKTVLDGGDAGGLRGKLVVIGSSAPEAGGLRGVAGGRLASSSQIQAEAVSQLLNSIAPHRPPSVTSAEVILAAIAAVAAAAAGKFAGPWRGALAVAAGIAAWSGLCFAAYMGPQLLFDPLGVPMTAIVAFATAALVTAAETRRREDHIRRRFEQHLAPEVVTRIVERPDSLKLDGEMREITSLFTDVEGFTSLTERAQPFQLIALLDRYFDGISRIVAEHGGLTDKIVGDAVHAIFNAPLDLADHAAKALACGLEIVRFSDAFQKTPEARALKFGRTRVGMETGPAVVGDVGGGRKLDYTAHGNAVNAAARLEAANKVLGTTLCVGGGTVARLAQGTLRPLGTLMLRGQSGAQPVFDPWPSTFTADDRRLFSAAVELLNSDVDDARERLRKFAQRFPDDHAIQALVARVDQEGV